MSECPTCGSGYFALAGHYKEIESERDALRARVQELEALRDSYKSRYEAAEKRVAKTADERVRELQAKFEAADNQVANLANIIRWMTCEQGGLKNFHPDEFSTVADWHHSRDEWKGRAEAAETRVARLEEALRHWLPGIEQQFSESFWLAKEIRAALEDAKEPTP